MNYNSENKRLGVCETVFESTVEHSLEADLNLPDYCPEIQRILKCNVCAQITSFQNISGRVTAQGNAEVKLIYVGENGRIAAFEQNYPIQKSCENNALSSECAVSVKVNTDYVNCRAVNSRRADVRAMLTFIFKATKKREENVLCEVNGAGLQTINETFEYASLSGVCEKAFALNEVIEISGKSPVSQIINISASAVSSEMKVINNKALLKGECRVKIYYISENENTIENIEHSMPINQIIEMDGLVENSLTALKLGIRSSQALTKVDSSGEMKLIDISVNVSANLTAFEIKPLTLIKDCYSTDYDTRTTPKSFEILKLNESFNTSFTNKVVLESIGVSVNCVNAVWCSDMKYGFSTKDKKTFLSGTYLATVIYRDAEGKTDIVQKTVDFEYVIKTREDAERTVCFGGADIVGCVCTVSADSRLDLKTEIELSGIVLTSTVQKYISSIEINDTAPKKADNCALTVYFCENGERLWNIAKKYNTTVSSIAAENDISEDFTDSARMLLIPGV